MAGEAERRELGRSGIMVGPLALGTNVFGWTADEATSHRILDAFTDAGLNLVDTANMYSSWVPGHKGGESEAIIGNWIAKSPANRDKIVLATKVGMQMGSEKGLSRDYITRAVEESLVRLRTDHIDLYQSHQDDPDTPQEETLAAYGDLIAAGKVRAIGASNFSPARLAAALKISDELGLPRYETLQPLYNLYDRKDFESEGLGLCMREHVSIIPYFSLASGFLTGKYRSEKDLEGKARAGMVRDKMNARGMKILGALDKLAKAKSATPAQVSLAWLVAKGIAAPIASATSIDQLTEIIGATHLALGEGDMKALDEASAY